MSMLPSRAFANGTRQTGSEIRRCPFCVFRHTPHIYKTMGRVIAYLNSFNISWTQPAVRLQSELAQRQPIGCHVSIESLYSRISYMPFRLLSLKPSLQASLFKWESLTALLVVFILALLFVSSHWVSTPSLRANKIALPCLAMSRDQNDG